MKKLFIVIVLFALPIVAYLFFASGVHNFAKLPVLTEGVHEIEGFSTVEGGDVTLQNNITILGFFGEDPDLYSGHAYNLAGKIYDSFFKYKDFQVLITIPEGTQEEVVKMQEELSRIVDMRKWKFIVGSPDEITSLFNSLDSDIPLKNDLSTPYVFIIDRNGDLRGRKNDEDKGILYGYDTRSVSLLDDKMDDDIKVILAEYRMELKKNNPENK